MSMTKPPDKPVAVIHKEKGKIYLVAELEDHTRFKRLVELLTHNTPRYSYLGAAIVHAIKKEYPDLYADCVSSVYKARWNNELPIMHEE